MIEKKYRIDWSIVIPLLLWWACILLSIGKNLQLDERLCALDWIDIFNSNTFATYIAIVLTMLYQYFSIRKRQHEEYSGLARNFIPMTIIITIIYGIVAIINACRFNIITSIIMAVISIIYVTLFFTKMRLRHRMRIRGYMKSKGRVIC